MIGFIDPQGRALVSIDLREPVEGKMTEIVVWVDTGFTGDLVLPRSQIASLGLPLSDSVRAVLADGSPIQVDTYRAEIAWFGALRSIEVIMNDGNYPLLSVGLLRDRRLVADNAAGILTLD